MIKKIVVILAALMAVSARSFADTLPKLAAAQEITEGELSNGIKYYLVRNTRSHGKADFSVVQKNFSDSRQAEHNLVSLTHFGDRRPCDYLSDHGVGYPKGGFVRYRDGNTRYYFPSVPVKPQELCDSTILMLLDITSTYPGEQALIISGDLDIPKVKERLGLLSLAISPRQKFPSAAEYEWIPQNIPSVYYSGSTCEGVSSLRITYSSARIPDDRMGTAQPVVTRQYSMYLGTILDRRIKAAFKAASIPLADLQYRYRDSAESSGNELYTLTVSTASDRFAEAVRTVAAILADIDARGVSLGEFEDAKAVLVSRAFRDGGNRNLSDSEYVSQCTDAFLHGASLASEATINGIFVGNSLPVSAELPIFNLFVSALLDSKNNLILGFDTPGAAILPELESAFSESWHAAVDDVSAVPAPAPLRTQVDMSVPRNKTKVEERQTEAMTGGTSFRITNGLRVVCLRTNLSGELMFSFQIKGGSALASGVSRGESAFLTDMLNLCEVGGMSWEKLRAALSCEGITICQEVTPVEIRISGRAPKDKLPLVLKALKMLSGTRTIPSGDFEYYKSCEALRTRIVRCGEAGIRIKIDSLLDDGRRLPGEKNIACLGNDLPRKAQNFFNGRFAGFSSGVLSVMGDLDIDMVEKQVCQYLGDIPSASESARPRVILFSPYGKDELYGYSSAESSAHLAWMFQNVSNDSGRMAVRLAVSILQKRLPQVASALGYSFSLEHKTVFYPQEMEKIYLDCSPCSPSSLPEGTSIASPQVLAIAVGNLVSELSVSSLDLASPKEELSAELAEESADTDYMMEALSLRYSLGRDIVSGSSRAAGNVAPEQVQDVYKKMISGRQVKYIVP